MELFHQIELVEWVKLKSALEELLERSQNPEVFEPRWWNSALVLLELENRQWWLFAADLKSALQQKVLKLENWMDGQEEEVNPGKVFVDRK